MQIYCAKTNKIILNNPSWPPVRRSFSEGGRLRSGSGSNRKGKKMNRNAYLSIVVLFSGIMLTSHIQTTQKKQGDAWRKRVFDWIYKNNHWAPEEGIPLSGPGSTLESTVTLRLFLPVIVKAVDAKSILDAGCGDFTWMQSTKLGVEKYIGADIAQFIINKNKETYENEIYSFCCLDVVKDELPKVDIIFCRDCLAHLSNEDITAAIKNFKKSGATYLLASTYPKVTINNNMQTGNFRGVNLRAYPFNFPVPILMFEEISAERDMKRWGKWMALWRLEDIEVC